MNGILDFLSEGYMIKQIAVKEGKGGNAKKFPIETTHDKLKKAEKNL